jgi:hypothetical protein
LASGKALLPELHHARTSCRYKLTALQAILKFRRNRCAISAGKVGVEIPKDTFDINLLNGFGLVFFFFVQFCLVASLSLSIKRLHFERMLASSVFLDVRVPNFESTLFFKLGAGSIIILTAVLAGLASMIILDLHANPPISGIDSIGTISVTVIALFGSGLFGYKYFSEAALSGFLPRHSFNERSAETLARIAQTPIISVMQLKLVARAFIAAARMAQSNAAVSKPSAAAFKRRLGSTLHIFAASPVITPGCVLSIESAAYAPGSGCMWAGAPLALRRARWLPLVECVAPIDTVCVMLRCDA